MSWTLQDIGGLSVDGMPDDVQAQAKELFKVHLGRWALNYKRTLYCDTEQEFKDLGLSLPIQLRSTRYVLGWANQAVKKPAMRTQFAGLKMAGTDDPFELAEVLEANSFGLEFSQAVMSAYKHGCAFVTVSKGADGEAPVQIIGHSAEFSAGIWDARARRLSSALTIGSVDSDGRPLDFTVWLRDANYFCWRDGERWFSERYGNATGRVQVVPVVNDPQLGAPLGRSRLTRSVMILNDIAVRTMARMEGNAEIYSSPQIALLGLAYDAFTDGGLSDSAKLKMATDRLMAISRDENDNIPELKQLTQASMAPHSDMMRTVAMAFAGETGIPPSALGVIQDNPSSAEAIRANEHDLLIDVTRHNKLVHSVSVREIAQLAVMVRDGLSSAPSESWRLSPVFVDPEFRSLSAEADALTKIAPVMPTIAQYPVLMERVFDEEQIARIVADRDSASDVAGEGLVAYGAQVDGVSAEAEQAKTLSEKYGALGVAIRAGVEPEDAAARLGLGGTKFTGAVPVSLRMPVDETVGLEDK